MSANIFRQRIRQSIADENLQIALDGNASRRTLGRLEAVASIPDYQVRRARLHAIKADVVAHLDQYLDQFIAGLSANGIHVHRAADGREAIRIFLEIANAHHVRLVAKSKSMLSEEIEFNHAVQAANLEVVETDLGEYIVQLRGERPSHILTPAVHLRRGQVGQLFHEKLGVAYTEDIPEMVATARRALREVFLQAGIGVSGVNFGVAETGMLCLVTNEGNGRMVTCLPPVHVALMGIERLVPKLEDLALFLSLLPRSATGQKLSAYTSLIRAPKGPLDPDGAQERHVILVDNGRKALQASPLSEALFCIRCGACLNACPVFREISGLAYSGRDGSIAPYPGPIGSVLSPALLDCENYGQLAQASTLCGACKEACPVDIDLPAMLLRVRAGEANKETKNKKQNEGVGIPKWLKLGLQGYRVAASSAPLFSLSQWLGGVMSRVYSPRHSYMKVPAWSGWGFSKDFPRLATKAFRRRWKMLRQEITAVPQNTPLAAVENLTSIPKNRTLADQFSEELSALGGNVLRLPEDECKTRLAEFLQARGVDQVCCDLQGEQFLSGVRAIRTPEASVRVGVTGALLGIADTGSLVLVGGKDHPLSASLLPDAHVAILREADLVPSLAEALARAELLKAPAAVIISGPSRTADIEMTLTIGVHGPKELFVFLLT